LGGSEKRSAASGRRGWNDAVCIVNDIITTNAPRGVNRAGIGIRNGTLEEGKRKRRKQKAIAY